MTTGKIDSFHPDKGYGFIQTEDAEDDVFFHIEDTSAIDLAEGEEVEFEIEQEPKGPRAKNLHRLGSKKSAEQKRDELREFFESHAPKDDVEVNIKVSKSELEGQFERLSNELNFNDPAQRDELAHIGKLIKSIIEDRLEAEQLEMSEEMKEATANIIASTLAQEYEQTSRKL